MATIPLKEIVFPGLDNTYTIPEIDSTLSTAGKAADAKKTGDELTRLKHNIVQGKDGVENLGLRYTFVQGGLSSGVLLTSYKYRVATNDLISFDRDIVLMPKAGFKFGLHTFVSGSYSKDSGWVSTNYFVPRNTTFKIVIARKTENTSELADVNEFVNAVLLHDFSASKINAIAPYIKSFSSADFMTGVWENGAISNWNKRLCTSELFPVYKGNTLTFGSNSTLDVSFGVLDFDQLDHVLQYSGWISQTGDEKTVAFLNDGYFFLQLKKSDDGTISDSDFTGSYVLNAGSINGIRDEVENFIGEIPTSEWEQGGIYNGNNTTDSARIRTALKTIIGDSLVLTPKSGYNIGVTIYNINGGFVSASPWSASAIEVTKSTTNVYYRAVLRKSNDASIIPDESTNVIINNRLYDLTNKLIDGFTVPKPYSYTGEKVPSKLYSFDALKALTMSYSSPLTAQDIECFDNYLFVAFSGTEQIKVYSLSSKNLVASIEIETQHGGGMQFSNEYYDENDDFPLLYVGGYSSDNQTNVIRITRTDDTWSAEIIRKIVFPTSEGYHLTPSIDAEHNTLYVYGYSINNYQSPVGNSMKLIKADLNNMTDNGNGTYTPKIISSIESPFIGTMQGRKYFGGNLYVGFANVSSPHNPRLVIIDATSGDIKADISMSGITTSENEGVCYQIVGNDIFWYYSDYYNVFKVLF